MGWPRGVPRAEGRAGRWTREERPRGSAGGRGLRSVGGAWAEGEGAAEGRLHCSAGGRGLRDVGGKWAGREGQCAGQVRGGSSSPRRPLPRAGDAYLGDFDSINACEGSNQTQIIVLLYFRECCLKIRKTSIFQFLVGFCFVFLIPTEKNQRR